MNDGHGLYPNTSSGDREIVNLSTGVFDAGKNVSVIQKFLM